jgi:transcriptional regulator with XRE-family HTH domain
VINERRAFGERLRRQREKQHVTLDQIAAATKVAASLFAGLEKGDCSRWPGGMYNRSFIRGYAAAVRLDPDDTAAEFAECYNTPPETSSPASPSGSMAARHAHPPPPFALRLKLEMDPEEVRRRAARRAVLAVVDVLVVAAVAGIVALTAGIAYWSALAIFSIAYQVAVRLLSGVSPAERLLGRRPRMVVPEPILEDDGADDAAVGDTASTIA